MYKMYAITNRVVFIIMLKLIFRKNVTPTSGNFFKEGVIKTCKL